jgi:Domain of unknown function DUF11
MGAGAGLLVLLLLVFGFKGCLDSRKESAINNYVTDLDGLVQESNTQGEAMFNQLEGGDGGTAVDVENTLNSYRVESAQLVDRARDLDPPGDLERAQGYLVETLQFRAEGIKTVADQIPSAISDSDNAEGAAREIAKAMQVFLASDQIYFRRVLPEVNGVLKDEGLTQKVDTSFFLQDLDWLQPAEVASRLSGIEGGTAGDGDAAPGTHGNGIGTVTLGGQTLVSGTPASVTLSSDLSFDVQVLNQGENTETDVTVNVTVGSGSDAVKLKDVLDEIAAGETQTVSIPLKKQPPTGQTVPIQVEIETVPGEDPAVGNNEAEFSVIFTS